MSQLLLKDYKSLAICLFLSTLLLFPDVPIWCFSLGILFWLWRLFCHIFDFTIPSRTITGVLSFLALAVILLDFRTLMGKEPAASFIVILSGLKALEFGEDSEKDFLVLLGFFLTSSKFLFSYDLMYLILSIPIYAFLTLNLFPVAWIKANRKSALGYLGKIILLATPMAALMFIFFPRITKTLLEMPTNTRYGSSGFSDSVSPGSISQLSLSNEVVFRLELFNKSFNLSELYFSGLTLERNNLMSWSYTRSSDSVYKSYDPVDVDYKIILEPHMKNNIFSLKGTDRMISEGNNIYHDSNFNFRFDAFLEKRAFIQASIGSPKIKMDEGVFSRNSEMPDLSALTPEQQDQLKKLIQTVKGTKRTPEEIRTAWLDYFANGRFEYTLNPGLQAQLNIHEFLFKQKKGYCEHFASALALLLRLSHVPARVVIGYHGGDFNPIGKFWTIRQKDAHAWVEFIGSNRKWIMVDPVSVIAPQRIELGSALYGSIMNDLLTEDEIKSKMKGEDVLSRLSMWFDNVNYRWSSFLLEFDFEKQKDILRSLNLSLGSALIIVLVFLFLVSVGLNLFQRRGQKRKFTELCFLELNNWAAQYNLQKKETEGPMTWLDRLSKELPEKNKLVYSDIKRAFDLWIQVSYGPNGSESASKRSLSEIRKTLRSIS